MSLSVKEPLKLIKCVMFKGLPLITRVDHLEIVMKCTLDSESDWNKCPSCLYSEWYIVRHVSVHYT